MKRLMVMLTVVAAVLCLTAVGFAQTLTCHNCKCALRNIPCATDAQGVTGACGAFDFDDNGFGWGYDVQYTSPKNCRAIFAICDCPDPTVFVEDLEVQVRMEILVAADDQATPQPGDNGAYWAGDGAPAAINFTTYPSVAAACADTQNLVLDETFGAQTYYLADGTNEATPYSGTACPIDAANRAVILLTDENAPYTLDGDEGSYWVIDIPPMRIAPASIAKGSVIYVKITLIDVGGGSICAECNLCECIIAVAKVCPDDPAPAPETKLTYNYYTSLGVGDYWNGIAIANPGSADGSCTLTAQQQGGGECTATVDVDKKSMFVDLLENITWTGTVNGAPAYIKVKCNFSGAFGFAMMSNGTNDSMGYVPTKNGIW